MIKDGKTLDIVFAGSMLGLLSVILGGILITLHNVHQEVKKDTFYLEPCLIPPPIYKNKVIYKKVFVPESKKPSNSRVLEYGSGQCIKAYHACDQDKGCHANGCTELLAYYDGLQGPS